MAMQRDPSEIGALWERSGAKGKYMTGQINGQDVILFPVNSSNPKAPTWRVKKSQPRNGAPGHATTNAAAAADIEHDDIPLD